MAESAVPDARLAEREAERKFLDRHFDSLGPDVEWRRVQEIRDATHVHWLYALHYRGRRVVGQYLRTHYRHEGWIDYATNGFARPFAPITVGDGNEAVARVKALVKSQFQAAYGVAPSSLDAEPVVWLDKKRNVARAAVEVRLGSREKGIQRRFLADEASGRVLLEYRVARYAITNKVYKTFPPLGTTTATPFQTDTLAGLADTATMLKNAFIYVQRARGDGSGFVDVDPTHDFTADAGFSGDPTAYAPSCAAPGTTACPNQSFDAINVYYHLAHYRTKIDGYLKALGVTSCGGTACFPSDPLPVIANLPSLSDAGATITDNNAAYLDNCSSVSGSFNRCLVFFKPGPVACGSGNVQAFDLAREANTIVHEFTHYITDSNTHMTRSDSGLADVGDALHEGYSDYFAASEVTDHSGIASTVILKYGFQNCTEYQRDVGTLKVYANAAEDSDEHVAGLTWASGLWQLRTDLGSTSGSTPLLKGDLLALKAQYFLSQTPNFVEAVEALVQADQALNAGANVAHIRDLFYHKLKFLGGKDGEFRDPATLQAEVGFQSCASAHPPVSGAAPSAGLLVAWLFGTLAAGRRMRRRA